MRLLRKYNGISEFQSMSDRSYSSPDSLTN
jgi:hypothetical protein